MRGIRRVFALSTLAVVVCLTMVGTAIANDTAVNGIGGSLTPMESTDIRMTAETIQAHVFDGYAEFVVDFWFENSGAEQTLRLGFPFRLRSALEIDEGSPGGLQVAGFQAWQNGAPIDVTFEEGEDKDGTGVGYFVHEVTFAPGVTKVRVRYLADVSADSGWPPADVPRPQWAEGVVGGMHAWYPYWVHTGAGWAGDIGTTVVRFTLSDDFLGWGVDEALHNDGASPFTMPTEGQYQWVMRDYEPTLEDDPRLSFYTTIPQADLDEWPTELLAATVTDRSASSELVLGEYSYPAGNAFAAVSAAWAEDASGSGVGEWVKAVYGAPRKVEEVRILPGYAKRPDLFYKYNRPKKLTLTFSDGSQTQVTLADEPSLQRFPVSVTTEWVRVTVDEVYPGTTRDETYVSLIDLGAKSPVYLESDALLAEVDAVVPGETTETAETTEAAEETMTADKTSEPVKRSPAALIVAGAFFVAFAGIVGWMLIKRAKAVETTSQE